MNPFLSRELATEHIRDLRDTAARANQARGTARAEETDPTHTSPSAASRSETSTASSGWPNSTRSQSQPAACSWQNTPAN